jgi:uncharacterized protein YigA (DUF484 family)
MKPDDVASFLTEHPDFFQQHPEVLGVLDIPHPQNGQAISLVERQSLMLRERIRALESRLAELIRHGEENDVIVDKLVRWSRAMLAQAEPALLPVTLVDELKDAFAVPFAAVRLWSAHDNYAELDFARPVGADAIRLAASMDECRPVDHQEPRDVAAARGCRHRRVRHAGARLAGQGPVPDHDGNRLPRADRGAFQRRARPPAQALSGRRGHQGNGRAG